MTLNRRRYSYLPTGLPRSLSPPLPLPLSLPLPGRWLPPGDGLRLVCSAVFLPLGQRDGFKDAAGAEEDVWHCIRLKEGQGAGQEAGQIQGKGVRR